MPNDKEKKYCVIDHADKSSDPRRANPNRLAKQKAFRRWPAACEEFYGDSAVASKSSRKKD